MQCGIEKCAVLILERGKKVHSDGIQLPGDSKIKALNDNECYKYHHGGKRAASRPNEGKDQQRVPDAC